MADWKKTAYALRYRWTTLVFWVILLALGGLALISC